MTFIRSYCRNCAANCGTILEIEDDRVVSIKGDRSHPLTQGYKCINGDMAVDLMNNVEERLVECQSRNDDRSFAPVAAGDLLDRVAARLGAIIEKHGPRSVALFYGTSAYAKTYDVPIAKSFLHSIGTPNLFTTMTIDQSAHWVTDGRMGLVANGRPHIEDVDTVLVAGTNPVISNMSTYFSSPNSGMAKFIKDLQRRGGKLIVVDPRLTETARQADIHLKPLPGHDAEVFAALIHIVLENGWQNQAFCDRFVTNLDALRTAVAPFTPDVVAARAGVTTEELHEVARAFALSPRPSAGFGTGVSMSPNGNTAAHMVEALNAICAGYARAGDKIRNPGVFVRKPLVEMVIGPNRTWEQQPQLRSGHGKLYGEFPSSRLIDEILEPGEGQIRALIVLGANPRMAFGDPDRFTKALESLDLLVVIDPRMTETAQLADFVVAPPVQYEVPDASIFSDAIFPYSFTQYSDAIVPAPPGTMMEWEFFNGVANRLGHVLTLKPFMFGVDIMALPGGLELTTDREWHAEDFIRYYADNSALSFDQIREHEGGFKPDLGEPVIQKAEADDGARLDVCPADVAQELAALTLQPLHDDKYLLISRRINETFNSAFRASPITKRRHTTNSLFMNPADMSRHGLSDGDGVRVVGEHGHIVAYAQAERGLRQGVLSITHCWGAIDQKTDPMGLKGAHTGRLVSMDLDKVAPIDAMPQQSSIPVTLEPLH